MSLFDLYFRIIYQKKIQYSNENRKNYHFGPNVRLDILSETLKTK